MKTLGEYEVENKILIVGGSGLLGSNINFGQKISSNDVDLLNYDQTVAFFKNSKANVIINAAAKKVSSKLLYENPVDYFDENIRMSLNVFKAAAESDVNQLIVFASINAFLDKKSKLESDSYNHSIKQILSEIYYQQYQLNSKVIFLGNVYGPNTKICNGAIPMIIDKCYKAKHNKENLILDGNGAIEREFTFVDDIISISKQFIGSTDNRPIIISSGIVASLYKVVDIIVKQLEFKGLVQWKGDTDKIVDKNFNTNVVKKLETDYKFTSLESGIAKTINWYKANV